MGCAGYRRHTAQDDQQRATDLTQQLGVGRQESSSALAVAQRDEDQRRSADERRRMRNVARRGLGP
jgi:hypothetical protein